VVPINVTAFTKDLSQKVDAYVGFTLADGYFGFAYNSPYGKANFSDTDMLTSLTERLSAGGILTTCRTSR